ncbi:MAG: hypothetical protein ACRDKT_13625 [Actinomycetota bacterium]
MRSPRALRTISVLACAGLLVGAFVAAPAEARKKKKKKKPAVCQPFQPGENGAEKPTLKVTDKATEEAPAVQAVSLDMSASDVVIVQEPASDAFNIQVDSKAKEAGVHILFEFPERRDYDLNVWHTDGSYAARAHGFQPVLGTPAEEQLGNTTGHAGESTTTSEHIVGIRTADCGGWTVSAENWLGEGGDFEIKVWLGAIENDPQAPGEEMP